MAVNSRVDVITLSPQIRKPSLPALPGRAETWRKPLSVAVVLAFATALVLLAPPLATLSPWATVMAAIGHMLVITAALGRIWCAIYISGRKNAELCAEGPYAHARHPLYFFSWLGVCGLMLVFRQPLLVLAACAAFAGIYLPVIQSEERRLHVLFGTTYAEYRRRTPLFFPRWAGETINESRNVRLRPLVRALTEVFWFLAAAILGETLHSSGAMELARQVLENAV